MSDSMKAAIYLVALIIFFIVLLVLTIVVIAKGRSKDDLYDDDGYDDENLDDTAFDEQGDEEAYEEPPKEKPKRKVKREEKIREEIPEELSEDISEDIPESPAEDPEEVPGIPPVQFEDSAFSDSAFSDSAFDDDLSDNFDDFDDGMDEVGITEKLIGPDPGPQPEAPEKKKRSGAKQEKKKKASDEDAAPSGSNYWYNRMDVADRPDYKTPEMYYHYFEGAYDVTDELLTEMYDCALVRTEEIRFIAYGIEPKMIFGNESLLADGDKFIAKFKTKDPGSKDLVKVGEKWCSYVDKLFEIVEIHADAETIKEIKKELYDFGKNDIKEILKGR